MQEISALHDYSPTDLQERPCMKLRSWITLITLAILGVLVALVRGQLVSAWRLLGRVDLAVLSLILPALILAYYATGRVILTYLRAKGELGSTSGRQMARMALELNFVNHMLPSVGACGISYLAWLLGKRGVSGGRATIAQVVRFVLTYVTYIVILLGSVFALVLQGEANSAVIGTSLGLLAVVLTAVTLLLYVTADHARLTKFADGISTLVNRASAFVTRGRKRELLGRATVERFFDDVHRDTQELRRDRRLLWVPSLWAFALNCLNIAPILIALAALGSPISPAVVVVGVGVAAFTAAFSATPGGTGVYETTMVAFLSSTGVPPQDAIAGTLLARVVVLAFALGVGYVFYQLRVNAEVPQTPIGEKVPAELEPEAL